MQTQNVSAIYVVYPIEGKGIKKICKTETEAKETTERWNKPKPFPYMVEEKVVYEYEKKFI